jgi:hypothetical protein
MLARYPELPCPRQSFREQTLRSCDHVKPSRMARTERIVVAVPADSHGSLASLNIHFAVVVYRRLWRRREVEGPMSIGTVLASDDLFGLELVRGTTDAEASVMTNRVSNVLAVKQNFDLIATIEPFETPS